MTAYDFNSTYTVLGEFPATYPVEIIKNEPMFFNADLPFAYANGGPITRGFIESLPVKWAVSNPVLDSRVHMLMPGWFPCIPGFHHDDVPRSGPNGQPNYDTPEYRSEHTMGLVNGDICPTVFAVGKHTLPKVENGIVYKEWHTLVERQLEAGILSRVEMPSGKIIQFDWQAMHTGQRAKAGGWRWFVRLSRNTDRQRSMTNEIRRQVQVYLEFPMEGW